MRADSPWDQPVRTFSESVPVRDLEFAVLSVAVVLAKLGESLFGKVVHTDLLLLLAA
jgi:hypothetical protein